MEQKKKSGIFGHEQIHNTLEVVHSTQLLCIEKFILYNKLLNIKKTLFFYT